VETVLLKVLVAIKRVVDYNVRVRVKPDGSGVAVEGLKMSINPFDEIAIEEALKLKERGQAADVAVATVGDSEAQQQLRTALAMGADRALLIETELPMEPLIVARALRALIERERPDLVLLGKQAIDDDQAQTGQMLAALWDRPQATFASRLEIDGARARVTREIDAGLEVIDVDLPAVVTTDLRLNQPRYVKLPEILKAKKKPLEVLPLSSLGVDTRAGLVVERVDAPAPRGRGIRVQSAAELVGVLRERGVL
jgi:electron transfer flavoprotein beta subunit